MNAVSDRADLFTRLTHPGIIAVVRARSAQQVAPLSEALLTGGITAIEVTLTTPNALEAIRECRNRIGSRGLVGVGTVLDVTTCWSAIDAGAQFVVSPICRPELVEAAHAAGRPILLGAYTPTEAQRVHETGADCVKLFPADGLGPGYIRALRAPLPHLKIVPTGGVDLHTAADFLGAGCIALGVGSTLITRKILDTGDWAELSRMAARFVSVVHQFKTSRAD